MTRQEWLSTRRFRIEGAALFFGGCLMSFFWPFIGIPLTIIGWFWAMFDWARSFFIAAPEFTKVVCPACARPEELTLDTATWVCKECGVRSRFDPGTRTAMPLGQFAEPPAPTPPTP